MARIMRKESVRRALWLPMLFLAACSSNDTDVAAGTQTALLVATMELATPAEGYHIRREFAGRVEASRTSSVGFELGGRLAAVSVDEGAMVRAGEELARLDTDRLRAREAEAKAALAQAEARMELAEDTLARVSEALAFKGVSQQDYDEVLSSKRAAVAARDAARSRLESVRVDLEKSVLRAPYDSIVIARAADEGEVLAAGQVVLTLQESARPQVRIGVAGDIVDAVTDSARHTLLINGQQVPAVVRAVLPVRDAATRTVDVLLEVLEPERILPGDLARLTLSLPVEGNGYWVPLGSLAEGDRGLWTNFVAVPIAGDTASENGATHTLEPRLVEVLHEEADRVFVRGALRPEDRIVVSGLQRVVPGQAVRIAIRQARSPSGAEYQ